MYACTWTSSHHQKLSLYLLFESRSFLLHNCSMKFLRRITACFGNVAFMIHISGQIIAVLGAGGIVGPFPWVEYWKQGSWSFVVIMVYQEPHPERAWGLLFLWLVLSLPDYMLLPTGSCNCSSFFPSYFILRLCFFSLTDGDWGFALQWITCFAGREDSLGERAAAFPTRVFGEHLFGAD